MLPTYRIAPGYYPLSRDLRGDTGPCPLSRDLHGDTGANTLSTVPPAAIVNQSGFLLCHPVPAPCGLSLGTQAATDHSSDLHRNDFPTGVVGVCERG